MYCNSVNFNNQYHIPKIQKQRVQRTQSVPTFQGLGKAPSVSAKDIDIIFMPFRESIFMAIPRKLKPSEPIQIYDLANNFLGSAIEAEKPFINYLSSKRVFYDISKYLQEKAIIVQIGDVKNAIYQKFANLIKYNGYECDRFFYNLPESLCLKAGTAKGKLFIIQNEEDINKIKEPAIVFTSYKNFSQNSNPNIKGAVVQSENEAVPILSHSAAQMRSVTDALVLISDKNFHQNILSGFNGKYVSLNVNQNGMIDIKIIDPEIIQPSKPPVKVYIPKLDESTMDVLLPNQCTPDKAGNKAVNLNRLMQLTQQGKLDVTVPPFVCLTPGYINHLFDVNHLSKYKRYNDECCATEMNKLKKILSDNNINNPIIRSAMNAEDLEFLATPGIYRSEVSELRNEVLYNDIIFVAKSKNFTIAQSFYKKNNIPIEDVQPCIVIQNCINPEYKFTIYTDDGNGNLIIDLSNSMRNITIEEQPSHSKIIYNKKSKSIVDMKYQPSNAIWYWNLQTPNDKYNFILPIENNIYNSSQFRNQLQRVIDQALIVEKEFGCPQDIEGGFSLGKSDSRKQKIKSILKFAIPKTHPLEKANILFLTTASGLVNNSFTGAAYGLAGGLSGMLIGRVINFIRAYRQHSKFYDSFFAKNLENVLPKREIFFWQTRNIVDKIVS